MVINFVTGEDQFLVGKVADAVRGGDSFLMLEIAEYFIQI
jgi:hypothetical protein